MLEKVRARANSFDILHFHTDYYHFPMFRLEANRALTTLHGRQDLPDLRILYSEFREMPLISISDAQRAPIRDANFLATIHHGVPRDLYQPVTTRSGEYFAFLGRISPEKRCDRAIEISRAAGIPLKIGAKVDKVDRAYFDEVVAPLLGQPGVEYIGEIEQEEKNELLANAAALLFPIDWPEPFGLAMIEAMACGTPVLAFRCGSVSEIVEDGTTGYAVTTTDEAMARIDALLALDRSVVRKRFEERFSADRMASDYVKVYESLLNRGEEVHQAVDAALLRSRGQRPHQDDAQVANPRGVAAA
jgi:glycosyltransferase involved in cell wall biosynthesis